MQQNSGNTEYRTFAGRRALVTGASSGLGAHFAGLLARGDIDQLFVAARSVNRLKATADACQALGAKSVTPIAMDVTNVDSVSAGFAEIERAGGIDLLVNNVGMTVQKPALDCSVDDFDGVMNTNIRGAWLCAQAAGRLMSKEAGGDIVNIASILGLRVANAVTAYAISKAGVIHMTKALAVEWARFDIRVNALAPGYFETDLNRSFFASDPGQAMIKRIPMRRLGTLADLDSPFTLLASGASRYLTGAILTVDGGHHINSV